MFRKSLLLMTVLMCVNCLNVKASDLDMQNNFLQAEQNFDAKKMQATEKTKQLIVLYRRDPSLENKTALFKQVEINFNQVLESKKVQLETLKKQGAELEQIEKLQAVIDTMIDNRKKIISQTMRRYTNETGLTDVQKQRYLPIDTENENIEIGYTPVTNENYMLFVQETGYNAPKYWVEGKIPTGKEKHPVVGVSYHDALAYCKWLTGEDGEYRYRLPTMTEWEKAAGPMPKKAKVNCEQNKGTTPVDTFAKIRSACGAVDMWGNVWEWTSTEQQTKSGYKLMMIKGGSWASSCIKSRTEYRWDAREAKSYDDTIGFRVVRERLKDK
ncbi:MAG: SUMF1/EgtB/PvdO family nonheme iron enzyme [Alphaproteobacteria bacterium]|nr:SUMF1/EgtB/PvdO family nonheme iron enzyme [Alphaproteobacteria bacterium]